MTPATIGIIIFAVLIIMIVIGIPIYIAMFSSCFVGFVLVSGSSMALSQFTTGIFSLSATYKFAVIPLFILMGVLAGESGIAEGTFDAARKWTGRVKGGLMMGTIFANLIFGACSGMSAAANAVFGKVAYPQLKKSGYNESFSLGCIAASGALSSLIPPSMGIIMFCILTGYSIGTAFTTGILPGILTAILYCVIVRVKGRVDKGSIPEVTEEDRAVTMKEKLITLRLLFPMLILFAVIVGGSYFGWFAPTVAGAIGAFVVMLYAFFTKMSIKKLMLNIIETAKMNALVFPMIIGGMLFSRFVTLCGLADAFTAFISGLGVSTYLVMMVLLVFYLIMGCIMDIMSILIITVPIVVPILTSMGVNPYVLCIIIVFICEIAGLTPPVGMNVFGTAAVLRLSPSLIFKGVWPFFFVDLLMVILLIFIPGIATWLPNLFS